MRNNHLSPLDQLICHIDEALRTVCAIPTPARPTPGQTLSDTPLTTEEQRISTALMRINHTGEVCAQALYRGQLAVAQQPETIRMLAQSCLEETDHLAWTAQRIQELEGRKSWLNIAWYSQSFLIGLIAGLAGDPISLGFIEETEQQVGRHLERHLAQLPANDTKSRAIVTQMREDELQHAEHAKAAGGQPLPKFIQQLMTFQSKVMTTLTYWI